MGEVWLILYLTIGNYLLKKAIVLVLWTYTVIPCLQVLEFKVKT